MYTSDPSLVRALHPGLLSIVKVVEPSPQKSKFGRKVKFHVIFFALFFYSYIFGSVSTEKHSSFFEKEKEVTSLTCDSRFPDASIMLFCPHTCTVTRRCKENVALETLDLIGSLFWTYIFIPKCVNWSPTDAVLDFSPNPLI